MNSRFAKFLVSVILLTAGTLGYAQTKYPVCVSTQTANTATINLEKPGHCVLNWDAVYNSDLDLIDSILSGKTAVPALTLLANPTQAMQAATKSYVDSSIAALPSGGSSGCCIVRYYHSDRSVLPCDRNSDDLHDHTSGRMHRS
jgi:hypothetical protein